MSKLFIKYVVFFSITISFVITNLSLADDKKIKKFVQKQSENTIMIVCNEKTTLEYVNLDKVQCISHLKKLSLKCNSYVEPLVPEIDDSEITDKDLKKIESVAELYLTCIKTQIYESKEKIIFD